MRSIIRAYAPLAITSSLLLSACGQASNTAPSSPAADAKSSLSVAAPAGEYKVDLNHADLSFSVSHLGIAPYIARFKNYQAELTLAPDNWPQSSIRISVDPHSVVTGYVADYKATHKQSSFDSWEEDLARSDRFLMADTHPELTFQSTSVQPRPEGKLQIDGQLTLRGQTHPLSLVAEVTGSTASHPFSKRGAIGFHASGEFKRSDYGMTFMQGPGLLGDEVSIQFTGEFQQVID